MNVLKLYSIFHLNLMFSSIEEQQREEVIHRCYWPLLKLAEDYRLPLGIEASGLTLEIIQHISPGWIRKLRSLIEHGPCEFIGSGYSQLIGPLVPSEVNAANLRLGCQVYEQLLGLQPTLALVNEQAYSAGLVSHYLDAGYQAMIMEWDNPASQHTDWNPEWRYLPQRVCGTKGRMLPVIWNQAIVFQKFQRYVHGELSLDNYVDYLASHCAPTPRTLSLYGNDVEIFDFRPGRFRSEGKVVEAGEWQRIKALYHCLQGDARFELVAPSRVLDLLPMGNAGQPIRLESVAYPVPVKKQPKYNLSRWAITGRNDLWLNTACYRLYQAILENAPDDQGSWRCLCRLWSSDLRTHITDGRWRSALRELDILAAKLGIALPQPSNEACWADKPAGLPALPVPEWRINHDGERHLLHVGNEFVRVTFNTHRGLAIQSLSFKSHGFVALVGTVPHGYFDHIEFGADFYTGCVVIEMPCEYKRITDLIPVVPKIVHGDHALSVSATIETELGSMVKQYALANDSEYIQYSVSFPDWQRSRWIFRLGHVTLLAEAFSHPLHYGCKNGGNSFEWSSLANDCAQTKPVSTLVSANSGLGATSGELVIGDNTRGLNLTWDPAQCAAFPMILHQQAAPSALSRVVFSLAELDETSRDGSGGILPFALGISPYT